MTEASLVNGVATGLVDVNDRGLQYGDGLFETLHCDAAGIHFWSQHMARMQRGAARLGIACPDDAQWLDDIGKLTRGSGDSVIKLVLTRGSSERGYAYQRSQHPTRIVSIRSAGDPPADASERGITATLCQHRLSMNPILAGIKHLNRLDNVLARAELDKTVQEGIVLDQAGNVIEGTMSNLFLVRGGSLATPLLEDCGVEGIIREQLLAIAREQGIEVAITRLTVDDCFEADELLFCNSLIGTWPVAMLDDRQFGSHTLTDTLTGLLQARGEEHVRKLG